MSTQGMCNGVFTEQLLSARLHIRYHLFHQGSAWVGPQVYTQIHFYSYDACILLAPPFLSHLPLLNARSCAM